MTSTTKKPKKSKPRTSRTQRDKNFIIESLKKHNIDPTYKVEISKRGHGYYHVSLGKAHNKSSWFINSNVLSNLQKRFDVNFCAKKNNIEATLIRKVKP